jgi:hypothetical protein
MSTPFKRKGCGPRGLGAPKGSPLKKNLDETDPWQGVPFKGANSSNSSCWKGYKKVGTKKSPTNPGVTVNDCKKI